MLGPRVVLLLSLLPLVATGGTCTQHVVGRDHSPWSAGRVCLLLVASDRTDVRSLTAPQLGLSLVGTGERAARCGAGLGPPLRGIRTLRACQKICARSPACRQGAFAGLDGAALSSSSSSSSSSRGNGAGGGAPRCWVSTALPRPLDLSHRAPQSPGGFSCVRFSKLRGAARAAAAGIVGTARGLVAAFGRGAHRHQPLSRGLCKAVVVPLLRPGDVITACRAPRRPPLLPPQRHIHRCCERNMWHRPPPPAAADDGLVHRPAHSGHSRNSAGAVAAAITGNRAGHARTDKRDAHAASPRLPRPPTQPVTLTLCWATIVLCGALLVALCSAARHLSPATPHAKRGAALPSSAAVAASLSTRTRQAGRQAGRQATRSYGSQAAVAVGERGAACQLPEDDSDMLMV